MVQSQGNEPVLLHRYRTSLWFKSYCIFRPLGSIDLSFPPLPLPHYVQGLANVVTSQDEKNETFATLIEHLIDWMKNGVANISTDQRKFMFGVRVR